jgi:hypothetical protein
MFGDAEAPAAKNVNVFMPAVTVTGRWNVVMCNSPDEVTVVREISPGFAE